MNMIDIGNFEPVIYRFGEADRFIRTVSSPTYTASTGTWLNFQNEFNTVTDRWAPRRINAEDLSDYELVYDRDTGFGRRNMFYYDRGGFINKNLWCFSDREEDKVEEMSFDVTDEMLDELLEGK